MSANNYLKITKDSLGFLVCEMDADTHTLYSFKQYYPTLTEAIAGANKYMAENEVEYNLEIDESATRE